MASLTERISVTLTADVKALLRARDRGMSLGAVMRDIVAELVAEHDPMVTLARIEQREATIR